MRMCSITPGLTGQIELRLYEIEPHTSLRPRQRGAVSPSTTGCGEVAPQSAVALLPFLKASAEISPLVASISGSRQRCGTDLRVRHCSIVLSRTPRSRATVLTNFQSSWVMSSSDTDVSSVTQHPFGGGPDILAAVNWAMVRKKETKLEKHMRYKAQFKREREARGWSQEYLAGLLELSKANYEKYEGPPDKDGKIRKFPIEVIIDFCRLISADLDFFLTAEQRPAKRRTAAR